MIPIYCTLHEDLIVGLWSMSKYVLKVRGFRLWVKLLPEEFAAKHHTSLAVQVKTLARSSIRGQLSQARLQSLFSEGCGNRVVQTRCNLSHVWHSRQAANSLYGISASILFLSFRNTIASADTQSSRSRVIIPSCCIHMGVSR